MSNTLWGPLTGWLTGPGEALQSNAGRAFRQRQRRTAGQWRV